MPKINRAIFNRDVNKLVFSKDIQSLAYQRASKDLEKYKRETLAEFNNHVVTQELDAGPDATNISDTLPGTREDANLFSFIGFSRGDKPTDQIRQILNEEINISNNPASRKTQKGVNFAFPVNVPTLKSIEERTPLPWEKGRSWIKGIERGISGLGYFLSGIFGSPDPSRSGGGIQSDYKVRGGSFSPTKYLSEILKNLKNKLN